MKTLMYCLVGALSASGLGYAIHRSQQTNGNAEARLWRLHEMNTRLGTVGLNSIDAEERIMSALRPRAV